MKMLLGERWGRGALRSLLGGQRVRGGRLRPASRFRVVESGTGEERTRTQWQSTLLFGPSAVRLRIGHVPSEPVVHGPQVSTAIIT